MLNHITPIVSRLVIANILVFIILGFGGGFMSSDLYKEVAHYFILSKSNLIFNRGMQSDFLPIQVVTSFFAHKTILHIVFNMWALINFGSVIETVFGAKRFLAFYLFCGVVGCILVALFDPTPNPVLGASGAIFGLMTAFGIYFPTNKLTFFVPIPITLTAKNWVYAFGGFSLLMVILDFVNPDAHYGGNISHFGHLAGMVAAFIFFYSGLDSKIR